MPPAEFAIPKFEELYPNIKVEFMRIEDYWNMLLVRHAGGAAPDVQRNIDMRFGPMLLRGALRPLTEYINDPVDGVDLSDFHSVGIQGVTHDGEIWGLPQDICARSILLYNMDMFDEAGLPYPDETWTWDDLYEAAKKLTKPDKSQYGFLAALHNQEGFYNFIYQNGGTVITPDKKSGYDDPRTIEAMEFYVKFVKEGLSPLIFGDAERAEAMQNGLCAMGFFGSWNLSGFAANEYMAENFDVTILPAAPNGERASLQRSWICHSTEYQECGCSMEMGRIPCF